MCGITGFISSQFNKQDLVKMTNSLRHRGPDAGGYFYEENHGIGLGHRRLSILDLSADSNQPFYSNCGRYIMVYNGEVYNFKDIAKKYQIETKTTSDTEVILESFVLNGINCVKDFNGMFVIAIWDKEEEELFLFRDRMGIKPLYLYSSNETFAFASELKSITSLPLKFSVDYSAVSSFLHLGYIPHPMSVYSECKKLSAGCYGIYKNGALEIKEYWSIEQKISKKVLKDEKQAKKQLESLLLESVERRMVSDVPLGTFLSGGIDSSLVTSLAQKLSDKPVKTFSIGFQKAKFNEAIYAKKVAKHLNTDHHEFILSEAKALERVDSLLNIYDEPFADSSAIPTLLVSEMARNEVTVCLSGDGGDELFMGYGMYNWANRLNNPFLAAIRRPLSWGIATFGNERLRRRANVFNYPDKASLKSHLFSQEQGFFSQKELKELLITNTPVFIEEQIESSRLLDAMESQSIFDMKQYLKDDLLVKVDRASMFHSLEVRVPLIDHNLVEFSLNLDSSLKYRKGNGKYLLKEILKDYVPSEFFNRPKWGFSIPLENWLSRDLKYLIDSYLSEEILNDIGIFNYSFVNDLVQRFLNGESHLYSRIWTLIVISKFMHDLESKKA